MSKWKKTSEGLPDCAIGERVVCLISCRLSDPLFGSLNSYLPLSLHVFVLSADEYGWIDEADSGFGLSDSEWWILERDLVKDVIGDNAT